MTFWFAENFGRDYATQRATIERYRAAGLARKDAADRLNVLRMIVIDQRGKPQRGEPSRIARELGLGPSGVKKVRDCIEDFQRAVKYLVERARVSPVQAWALYKNAWDPDNTWAAIERGIQRSIAGRHAGARPRPGRQPY